MATEPWLYDSTELQAAYLVLWRAGYKALANTCELFINQPIVDTKIQTRSYSRQRPRRRGVLA